MKPQGWAAYITSPTPEVTSLNGVTVQRQRPLEFAGEADAVIIGSGMKTRDIAADADLLGRIVLDPSRQLIGAQCSGTLLLAKLGLVGDLPACTDLMSKPWVIEAGVRVLDTPFVAHGNVATAGGCLASQYLATWILARGAGLAAAEEAIRYVAPVGEKEETVARARAAITPFLPEAEARAA
ncbi:transcriptional regulator GlxA family with amidase domain [Sphingomonas naasensis]|nr:transcriptional regulator GlxA family with amidase domain [Sphingomonas naasensis]